MGHDEQHFDARQPGRVGGERVHLSAHSSPRLFMPVSTCSSAGKGVAGGAGSCGEGIDLGQGPKDGGNAGGGIGGCVAGPEAVQHGEHGAGQQVLDGQGFGQVGGEVVAAPGGVERGGNLAVRRGRKHPP